MPPSFCSPGFLKGPDSSFHLKPLQLAQIGHAIRQPSNALHQGQPCLLHSLILGVDHHVVEEIIDGLLQGNELLAQHTARLG